MVNQAKSKEEGVTYHVRRPTKLASDKHTWRVGDTVRNNNFLDLIPKRILHHRAQLLELCDLCFPCLLFLFSLLKLETLLRDTDELLPVELLELGNGVFIDWVDKKE